MKEVLLPKLPKGKEFEEYISACLQVDGQYIERNIVERDVAEILELDVISTNYSSTIPEIVLAEVKSGDWGFSDVFKVYGWMNYLNFPRALFIVNKERDNLDFIRDKASTLNINLVFVRDIDNCKEVLNQIVSKTNISDVRENDIPNWRFSYWVERKLIERLLHKKKSIQTKKCYKELLNYYHQTSSGIFFMENIIRRIHKLYSVFMDFPHITAKTGNELIGNDFDEEYDRLPDNVYVDTFYKCEYNDIQICLYLEHRARLAILKNAVDYIIYHNAGVGKKTENVTTKILGLEFKLMDSLPSSFKQGMNVIGKHKYFHRYPVFWQWFMWLFGGFILEDYENKEYEFLSIRTGIPVDEIPNALSSYHILFPIQDGWFINLPNSTIRLMKWFPVPFMGVGANYRRTLHLIEKGKGELPNINTIQVGGLHTLDDLITWNNLAVEVLSI